MSSTANNDEMQLAYECVDIIIKNKFGLGPSVTFPNDRFVSTEARKARMHKTPGTWYAKGTATQSCDKLREVALAKHLYHLNLGSVIFPVRNNWACILRPAFAFRFQKQAIKTTRTFMTLRVDGKNVNIVDGVSCFQVTVTNKSTMSSVSISVSSLYASYDSQNETVTIPYGNFDCCSDFFKDKEHAQPIDDIPRVSSHGKAMTCRYLAVYYKVFVTPQGIFVNTIPHRPFFKPLKNVIDDSLNTLSLVIRDSTGCCVTLKPKQKSTCVLI
jgi:hypothetical protein